MLVSYQTVNLYFGFYLLTVQLGQLSIHRNGKRYNFYQYRQKLKWISIIDGNLLTQLRANFREVIVEKVSKFQVFSDKSILLVY